MPWSMAAENAVFFVGATNRDISDRSNGRRCSISRNTEGQYLAQLCAPS
jgi:hypothetical protein